MAHFNAGLVEYSRGNCPCAVNTAFQRHFRPILRRVMTTRVTLQSGGSGRCMIIGHVTVRLSPSRVYMVAVRLVRWSLLRSPRLRYCHAGVGILPILTWELLPSKSATAKTFRFS